MKRIGMLLCVCVLLFAGQSAAFAATNASKKAEIVYSDIDKKALQRIAKAVFSEETPLNWLTEKNLSKWKGVTWSREKTARVTALSLNGAELQGALVLTGLTALRSLDCENNVITALDPSGAWELQHLACGLNPIQELDLSGNSKLLSLNCYYNELMTLDVSGLSQLEELDVRGNYFSNQSRVTGLKDKDFAVYTPQRMLLYGQRTEYISSPVNWFLATAGFGWVWMPWRAQKI